MYEVILNPRLLYFMEVMWMPSVITLSKQVRGSLKRPTISTIARRSSETAVAP